MPSATRTEVFNVGRQAFFDVVVDYTSYPEFVDNVTRVQIIKRYDDRIRAKFFLHLVKDFDYTLDLYVDPPKRVWWELVRGDIFKTNNGSWDLKPRGKNRTEVTYTLEIDTKVLVPKVIIRPLVSTSLPRMMRSFCDHALEIG